jgi:hypothetical protein
MHFVDLIATQHDAHPPGPIRAPKNTPTTLFLPGSCYPTSLHKYLNKLPLDVVFSQVVFSPRVERVRFLQLSRCLLQDCRKRPNEHETKVWDLTKRHFQVEKQLLCLVWTGKRVGRHFLNFSIFQSLKNTWDMNFRKALVTQTPTHSLKEIGPRHTICHF